MDKIEVVGTGIMTCVAEESTTYRFCRRANENHRIKCCTSPQRMAEGKLTKSNL